MTEGRKISGQPPVTRRQNVNFALATGFVVVAAQQSIHLDFDDWGDIRIGDFLAFAIAVFWAIKKYYNYDKSFSEKKSGISTFIDLIFLVLIYGLLTHIVFEYSNHASVGMHLGIIFTLFTFWNFSITWSMHKANAERVDGEEIRGFSPVEIKRRRSFAISSIVLAIIGFFVAWCPGYAIHGFALILAVSVIELWADNTFLKVA